MAYKSVLGHGKVIRVSPRYLQPEQLGGVIFTCTNMTIQECLTKELFGLPPLHIVYVKNIQPGLLLFLFNRDTRLLHGIFAAATSGESKIDPYFGLTSNESKRTPYPAQVHIRVLKNCYPLPEEKIKTILSRNYYTCTEFRFELDRSQVRQLIDLFSVQEVAPFDTLSDTNADLSDLTLHNESDEKVPSLSIDHREGLEALSRTGEQRLDSDALIYLVGGLDGTTWLDMLDCYSPSKDTFTSRIQMPVLSRSWTSAATLNGEIYVIGGVYAESRQNTVDAFKFNPTTNKWTSLPGLLQQNRGISLTTLNGNIFSIGGVDGSRSLSEVEMLDLHAGRWIYSTSMCQERYKHAVAELNGVIYAAGGEDNQQMVLSSIEQFDPRDGSWRRNKDMMYGRLCHSLVVLNEKLYAIGGFDDSEAMDSVEVFDPRCGLWTVDKSMIRPAAGMSVAVLGDTIYAIGGVTSDIEAIEKSEQYQEDVGWQLTNLKGVSRRGFASAVVI